MHKFEVNDKLKPGLYCVSTPIGNLGDITLRALYVLKKSDIILCEDTRVSGKLLSKFNIKTKMISNHKFNEKKNLHNILKLLNQKKIISVISDAGTPVISDPGSILINECILNNINIYPIPGVSASTTAISISGFSDKYFFGGFLPEKKKDLNNLFDIITKLNFSFVFFISPKKLKKIINEIQKYFIDNDILIAREISKLHEEYIRIKVRNLSELEISQKGEMTVVISQNLKPQNRLQLVDESVKKKINKLLKKMSIRDITSKIAFEHNVSKKLVYDYCLEKKNEL
ncbi:16S rRNA (cytidine(1402)-2'-O)-methyltransferase [Candidatus Pelagibacter sp.]|nr:16S rRNA (cytidine(1402)-2'-O)-methyltransferase [Candidatus Pelagibacter sp.]